MRSIDSISPPTYSPKVPVDVEAIFKSGNCSGDIPLEWGDIMEIPELDHGVNEPWPGLSKPVQETLIKCLKRQIEIVVKGERTKVMLLPSFALSFASSTDFLTRLNEAVAAANSFDSSTNFQTRLYEIVAGAKTPAKPESPPDSWKKVYSFRLKPVLQGANILRVSSDLSRLKVKRVDPATGQSRELLFDLSDKQPYDERTDLWLRDGDVIEVPEK